MRKLDNRKRQLNIEILRIFSMLLIFMWHINGHFMPYVPEGINHVSTPLNYLNLFITFHVDVFVLITGYFGIRKRSNAFIKTLLLCVFYALFLNGVSYISGGEFSLKEILLPLSSSPWWFLKVYLILVLIAPVIEKYIENTTERDFYILLMIAAFIDIYLGFFMHIAPYNNHGYDIFNFILAYLLGCWLRRSDKIITFIKGKTYIVALIFLLCCLVRYKVQPVTEFVWTDYNSPLNVVMALCVFCIFLKFRVPDKLSKFVMFFSSSAVSVYLITDYTGVRDMISLPFVKGMLCASNNSLTQLLFICLFVVIGFIICCIIDKIRIIVLRPISAYLVKSIEIIARGK